MSYTILLSTAFTLFTSFWCCIRPDFPSPHDSKLRILSAKLNIIFWVLICPEGVLFWSMRQWCEAGNIPKEILQNLRWTRRHALFFLMGGFILCDKDGRPAKTLSIRHLEQLIQHRVIDFPLLTSFEIQERSNLHPVFALLAFLQATWFLAKCVSRLTDSRSTSQGFPIITQLEAIVAVLVIATWSIFFFAWKKPLDPQFPILLKPNIKPSTVCSRYQMGYRYIPDFQWEQNRSQIAKRTFQFDQPQSQAQSKSVLQIIPGLIVSVTVWPFQTIFNDITRLYPPDYYTYTPVEFADGTLKIPLFYVENTMSMERLLLPTATLGMGTSIVSFLFVLRPDSAAFYFSSPTVHLIWRIASILTTSMSGFVLFLAVLIYFFKSLQSFFDPIDSVWNRRFRDVACGWFAILLLTLITGLAPFLLARATLLVTSLVCLKSVPGDPFVGQRSWIEYIPHF